VSHRVDCVQYAEQVDAIGLSSQRDGFGIDPLANVTADAAVAEYVNADPEQVFEILPERNEVQEGAPGLHLDEQVHIAPGVSLAAGRGAEHAQVARAVVGGGADNLIPSGT